MGAREFKLRFDKHLRSTGTRIIGPGVVEDNSTASIENETMICGVSTTLAFYKNMKHPENG
ncbi:hypothetical protein ACTXT7_004352 [Hymenolepis weldensis]